MLYTVVNYWAVGYATGEGEYDLQSTLQGIAPGDVVELFDFELNVTEHSVSTTYRFCNSLNEKNTNIVWQENTYTAIPIKAEGFEWSGKGTLPRPTITVGNLMSTISTILALLPNGLEGAKVTRHRTLGKFLDASNFMTGTNTDADTTAHWPVEIYYVDRKVVENRDVVTYELCSAFDLAGVRLPKRQILPDDFPGVGAYSL